MNVSQENTSKVAAVVKVGQGGMGRVYVYKNDDSCIVETEGSVTMRERKSGA